MLYLWGLGLCDVLWWFLVLECIGFLKCVVCGYYFMGFWRDIGVVDIVFLMI